MEFDFVVLALQNAPLLFKYAIVFLLGMAPISEVRGAILAGIGMGLNPALVFLIGLFANLISIPILFYFLRVSRINDFALKLFGKRAMRKIEKNKQKFELYEELALIFFVAIPLPFTGAWTAVLISHILQFNKQRSFVVISLGVFIAAFIVLASSMGISWLL